MHCLLTIILLVQGLLSAAGMVVTVPRNICACTIAKPW